VRRRAALLVLVASGVFAAAALASVTFKGHLNGHAAQKISFMRSGSHVTQYTLTNVIVTCDGGTQHINPSFTVNAAIDSGGHFKAIGGPTILRGNIAGSSATGTLIVDGSFSGSSQNCHLDRKWTASH
jgi:hypothetical protein